MSAYGREMVMGCKAHYPIGDVGSRSPQTITEDIERGVLHGGCAVRT